MANEEHLEILKQGVHIWNQWKDKHPRLRVDLSHANLEKGELNRVRLQRANLSGANFNNANLRSADLTGANLYTANLNGASLRWANLRFADLRKASLDGTYLIGTNLNGADLSDAVLSNASMESTFLGNNDLSNVIGLDSVRHFGPSTIGVDTLYKSSGRISKDFLRGCGVPDDFIEYLPSFIGAEQAIQFYSCFISYSSKDEEFAKRLYSRMRDEHLRVWFASESIKGGEKLNEQIEHAIQVHDRLLLVLSEHSMQSEWVMTEIRKARKVEIKENRQKLFPIRLVGFDTLREWACFDADSGKDLAIEVREYFIPDFSNWKDQESFESAFTKLLKDLRAAEKRLISS